MYEDLAWAARNVIEEGGPGWWGSDQLGQETNYWIPQVDCEFINKASPTVILDMIKKLDRLESDLNFYKQMVNQEEDRW